MNISAATAEQRIYATAWGTQLVGDSRDLLATLPPNSVDLIITSPPFALLREKSYGNKDQTEYVDWLVTFGKAALPALKDTGSFVITKTPDTPGCVSPETVKEQLLYEVHDAANYLTPDVVADFTTLRLEHVGENRVRVTGVTGKPCPEKLKVSMGRLEGFMRELIFTIGWPEAWRKVEQLQAMLNEFWRRNPAIERVEYSYLGMNSLYGSLAPLPDDPLEVIVRVMFTAQDQDALKNVVRQIMTTGLSGPAGMSVSGTTVGAEPRAIIGLWPTLVGREHMRPVVEYWEVW